MHEEQLSRDDALMMMSHHQTIPGASSGRTTGELPPPGQGRIFLMAFYYQVLDVAGASTERTVLQLDGAKLPFHSFSRAP
jgi:hypothetical protein